MYEATLLFIGYGLSWVDFGLPWMVLWHFLLVLVIAKFTAKILHYQETKPQVPQVDSRTSTTCTDVFWINELVAQLWPSVVQHITTIAKQNAEKKALEIIEKHNLGGNFRFQTFTIGSRPIYIEELWLQKSDPRKKETVIHVSIQYHSDCDVSYTWLGLPGSIKDLSVVGRAKVVLGPVFNSPPFVSNAVFKFLQKPTVYYHLSGIAVFLELFGLRKELENYMATMIINLGDTEKKTDKYDKHTTQKTNECDIPETHYKRNACLFCFLFLLFIWFCQ